ncbi:MAG: D-alanine--D-alanine ligase [Candidatus Bipolaricaulota bacterium]|nr:D-alanine--D-alanine ligase [Candidatus Bipolaricaulota bacterium]
MRVKGIIGVICGGDSLEREVSLISGRRVAAALEGLSYKVCRIEIENLDDLVPAMAGISVAFICLHGGSGEDGTVQTLLDVMEIAYTGSGGLASALAMDKPRSRAILRSKGLDTPDGLTYRGEELGHFCSQVITELDLPVVLKPADQGSSIGIRIADNRQGLLEAAEELISTHGSLLVEDYIPGRDLTVGVISKNGTEIALPVVEPRSKNRFYDYEAKYTVGKTDFFVPALLDEETTKAVKEAGLAAHQALGCRGFSRVDLRLSEEGVPLVLEVNTIPGMTPTSDLPQSAAVVGISFSELVDIMLQTAFTEV